MLLSIQEQEIQDICICYLYFRPLVARSALASVRLAQQRTHWDHYEDGMFTFEVEKDKFGLKPMNCPGHCKIFAHRDVSYKNLPMHLADFGVVHRNEFSGALTGLTRVRRFQQDDAHIFCTQEQVCEHAFYSLTRYLILLG
jgi:threonyl-tRNA synthetase